MCLELFIQVGGPSRVFDELLFRVSGLDPQRFFVLRGGQKGSGFHSC